MKTYITTHCENILSQKLQCKGPASNQSFLVLLPVNKMQSPCIRITHSARKWRVTSEISVIWGKTNRFNRNEKCLSASWHYCLQGFNNEGGTNTYSKRSFLNSVWVFSDTYTWLYYTCFPMKNEEVQLFLFRDKMHDCNRRNRKTEQDTIKLSG